VPRGYLFGRSGGEFLHTVSVGTKHVWRAGSDSVLGELRIVSDGVHQEPRWKLFGMPGWTELVWRYRFRVFRLPRQHLLAHPRRHVSNLPQRHHDEWADGIRRLHRHRRHRSRPVARG